MRSNNYYYIVLDFCNGGDLQSYVEKVKKVPEEVARTMIQQVINGMIHLN